MRAALLLIIAAACATATLGERARVVAEAPSGKHVAIYRSKDFATQQGKQVSEDVVVQAMRASSLFFEEDIRALAPKLPVELEKLATNERLVIETRDTMIYMYVANDELQILAMRDGHEVSRHASAIPSAAVKTELSAKPHIATPPASPTPPPAVEPAKPPPATSTTIVVQPPPPTVTVVPPPPPDPAHKPAPGKARPRPTAPPPAQKPGGHLSEAEIRAKLDELDRLRARGLITQDEYDRKKKALLDQL